MASQQHAVIEAKQVPDGHAGNIMFTWIIQIHKENTMKYQKPRILSTEAASSSIMGQKGIGVMDAENPSSPQNSVAAQQSDE